MYVILAKIAVIILLFVIFALFSSSSDGKITKWDNAGGHFNGKKSKKTIN
jgi:hypothetical protein